MASKLSGTMAARERGLEHDSRHPVMTEDMIRQLPAERVADMIAPTLQRYLTHPLTRKD